MPARFHEGPFDDQHAAPIGAAAGAAGDPFVDTPPMAPAADAPPADTAGPETAADTAAAGTTTIAVVQPSVPFYRKPGWWKSRNVIICQLVTACLGIALLFIILFPVVRAIAQHVVNASVLNIDESAITNPGNDS